MYKFLVLAVVLHLSNGAVIPQDAKYNSPMTVIDSYNNKPVTGTAPKPPSAIDNYLSGGSGSGSGDGYDKPAPTPSVPSSGGIIFSFMFRYFQVFFKFMKYKLWLHGAARDYSQYNCEIVP
jgi:hypothetical protein